MGKEGLHGSQFAITLDAYGYAFVAKGTEYTSNYKARIYQALKALQGYYLPTRAIVHTTLMSWGGKALKEDECSFFNEIGRTRSEISDSGIEHLDERAPNMLWNEEVQRVMFIDSGRAQVTQKRKSSGRKPHSSKPKRQRMAMRYEVVV
ncbi:hypothetical protein KXW10_000403 [Aspergillus fumigatus]|nr:hypothetical protein KXW10_000403 [Aspergillus fumigatus]